MIGWAVACALLGAAIVAVGDADRTAPLVRWIQQLSLVMVIWLVAFPLWATLFPGRAKRDAVSLTHRSGPVDKT